MIELRELSSLLALKNTGSFNAAAALLHVTPGAMSQRIKQIEESIGQILIVRSSPVRLTHAGETLIRLAQQVELLIDDARQTLIGNECPIGLTVAVNHGSLATWFSDVAIEFVSLGIGGLDVRCADQHETVKLLTDGTAVAAVSAEATPPSGCDCVALACLNTLQSPRQFTLHDQTMKGG
ncbi:LysR family transcriptional regulator [Mesorhizobium sp. PAMC28654]|uniref:LysR family transcriptional regulator n=1 Tax=Mesorhizobium sp. PAMC28654 TaxID=2880934 RepID=UPI001D0B7603|nr:LysR family transcriptional regulator [Mesorhizobium sp. PAMC28654]UDL90385.1 LysR family transcriptional regulator [Mesorhizobium sp. PAMC28654]